MNSIDHQAERKLQLLYLLNAALLIAHEIDSAYWKEWDLFGIPGGIQFFLLLNFLLALLVLFGFALLLQGKKSGLVCSCCLSSAGVMAFLVHGYFMLTGHPEFMLPVSESILVATFIVSVTQGFVTLRRFT
jgi:hypothetical protein